jgi:hypothetical protein
MDNASDFESEDCMFESCQDRFPFVVIHNDTEDILQLTRPKGSGPVAQWSTRLTTKQKNAGSSPARIEFLLLCYTEDNEYI